MSNVKGSDAMPTKDGKPMGKHSNIRSGASDPDMRRASGKNTKTMK